jgi:Flp pilus assembly protein TadG
MLKHLSARPTFPVSPKNGSAGSDDSGAAAVEFALILPILILLLVLLIDFGRMAFVQISVISASREGARYSSLFSSGYTSLQALDDFVQTTAPRASQVSQMASTAKLTVSGTPCSSTISNENTSVTVSTNFKWLIPLGLVTMVDKNATWANDFTISSVGSMRCMN